MIILIGPSASGKTEIAKKLISSFNYQKFVTTTTRAMRQNEKNKIDYYFISKEKFLEDIKQDLFIEYTIYNDNYYGSYKKEKDDNKVLIVEPNGLEAFKKLKDPHIVSFYIKSDENDRKERMIKRGDKKEDIIKRLNNDRLLFNDSIKTDFVIINKNSTLEELSKKINQLYKEKLSLIK